MSRSNQNDIARDLIDEDQDPDEWLMQQIDGILQDDQDFLMDDIPLEQLGEDEQELLNDINEILGVEQNPINEAG
jgi:hypothetical protein